MKKIGLLLLFALFVLPGEAKGPKVKIEWGAIAGLNVPDYSTDMSRSDITNRLGWHAGIITAVNFGAWSIDPQILYVRQGFRLRSEGESDVRIRSSSIDVPIPVSLRVLKPFRFYAGPVLTVVNDTKEKSGGDLLAFDRVRPTLSYTVGAAVKLRSTLIDLRYNGQFRAKHDIALPDGRMLDKLGSYSIALSFGYIF